MIGFTPWRMILLICLVVAAFGLRLGMKTARLTETDIIEFYVGAYLQSMEALGLPADSSDCIATLGNRYWERMIVMCEHKDITKISYSIGPWGQALNVIQEDGGI